MGAHHCLSWALTTSPTPGVCAAAGASLQPPLGPGPPGDFRIASWPRFLWAQGGTVEGKEPRICDPELEPKS